MLLSTLWGQNLLSCLAVMASEQQHPLTAKTAPPKSGGLGGIYCFGEPCIVPGMWRHSIIFKSWFSSQAIVFHGILLLHSEEWLRTWKRRGRISTKKVQQSPYKVRTAKQSGWLCCPCHLSACCWLCRGFQHFSAEREGTFSIKIPSGMFLASVSVDSRCLCCHHPHYTWICTSGHTAWSQQCLANSFTCASLCKKCFSTTWKSLLHLCTWAILLRGVTPGNCTRAPTSLERKCPAVPADRGCTHPGTPWASHTPTPASGEGTATLLKYLDSLRKVEVLSFLLQPSQHTVHGFFHGGSWLHACGLLCPSLLGGPTAFTVLISLGCSGGAVLLFWHSEFQLWKANCMASE